MRELLLVIFFIYGTIFGSFFNVVGLRVPNKTLFKQQRSFCDNCGKTLTWIELIPVGSYLALGGHCKGCQQKISLFYPVIEFLTGFLFAFTYYQVGWNHNLILGLLLISLVIPVTVSDVFYRKIPNNILLFFTPLFISYRLIYPIFPRWHSLLGALFAFITVFIVILLSKGGMGMGDLKYYTLFGFIFGIPKFLLLLFLSAIYGTIAGIIIVKVKKTGRKTKLAFGPYIGLAALTVYYFGNEIIQCYLQLFY